MGASESKRRKLPGPEPRPLLPFNILPVELHHHIASFLLPNERLRTLGIVSHELNEMVLSMVRRIQRPIPCDVLIAMRGKLPAVSTLVWNPPSPIAPNSDFWRYVAQCCADEDEPCFPAVRTIEIVAFHARTTLVSLLSRLAPALKAITCSVSVLPYLPALPHLASITLTSPLESVPVTHAALCSMGDLLPCLEQVELIDECGQSVKSLIRCPVERLPSLQHVDMRVLRVGRAAGSSPLETLAALASYISINQSVKTLTLLSTEIRPDIDMPPLMYIIDFIKSFPEPSPEAPSSEHIAYHRIRALLLNSKIAEGNYAHWTFWILEDYPDCASWWAAQPEFEREWLVLDSGDNSRGLPVPNIDWLVWSLDRVTKEDIQRGKQARPDQFISDDVVLALFARTRIDLLQKILQLGVPIGLQLRSEMLHFVCLGLCSRVVTDKERSLQVLELYLESLQDSGELTAEALEEITIGFAFSNPRPGRIITPTKNVLAKLRRGDPFLLRLFTTLCRYGADFNRVSYEFDSTLLMGCVVNSDSQIIEAILKAEKPQPIDANAIDTFGNTALHCALLGFADYFDFNIMRDLVAHGADLKKQNHAGETPLDLVWKSRRVMPRDLIPIKQLIPTLLDTWNPVVGLAVAEFYLKHEEPDILLDFIMRLSRIEPGPGENAGDTLRRVDGLVISKTHKPLIGHYLQFAKQTGMSGQILLSNLSELDRIKSIQPPWPYIQPHIPTDMPIHIAVSGWYKEEDELTRAIHILYRWKTPWHIKNLEGLTAEGLAAKYGLHDLSKVLNQYGKLLDV